MRVIILPLLLFLSIYFSYGQNPEYYRVKKNTGKVIITPHSNSEIVILRVSGLFRNARKIIYQDTINGYEVEIPKSMEIQETNSIYNFCYTIPREKGRDNSICINSAPKTDYENLDSFKYHIIENPEYLGEKSKSWIWGENSKLISVSKEKFNSYDSYKVQIQINKRTIKGQFIILETDRSFLWINFVADNNTFDLDIRKFSEFLKKIKLLE